MSEPTLDDLTVPAPPPGPADWSPSGVVIYEGMFDPSDFKAYHREWLEANDPTCDGAPPNRWRYFVDPDGILHADRPGGWPDATPYMRHPALRALLCDQRLADALEETVGEPMGLHLNLTGWVTTTRDWHQDNYLNPSWVGDHYAAVWIALGDIHPDSGPFQYVPGSHRWPQVTREAMARFYDVDSDPHWPTKSEEIVSPLFEKDIADRGAAIVTYLPKAGDVLLWHPRLLHRGSKANRPGMYRPALISHYTSCVFPMMPPFEQHERGGFYYRIGQLVGPPVR